MSLNGAQASTVSVSPIATLCRLRVVLHTPGGCRQAVVASKGMALWLLLTLMGLIKLVVAALMLWLPLRTDTAMSVLDNEERPEADEDGGSKTLQRSPGEPHPRHPFPRRPRRGPHGSPSPPSPERVRGRAARRVIARSLAQR
jgi:hypothetical protein